MSKVFFRYNKILQGYSMFEGAQTCNFILQDFFSFLRAWGSKDISWLHQYGGMTWESIHLSKVDGQDKVILWNSDYTKQMVDIPFDQLEKYKAVYSEYHQYVKKRWNDMPKLEMSVKNYEYIVQKWNAILERKPQYIIFSQNDAGYVDLVGNNELSEQDLADMKIEYEKCLKYKAAWDKYEQANSDRSEVWRSSVDDEYEADWQKFLDGPLD